MEREKEKKREMERESGRESRGEKDRDMERARERWRERERSSFSELYERRSKSADGTTTVADCQVVFAPFVRGLELGHLV